MLKARRPSFIYIPYGHLARRSTCLTIPSSRDKATFKQSSRNPQGFSFSNAIYGIRSSPSDSASVSEKDKNLPSNVLERILQFCATLYAFSRPHTVAGTIISICSISLLALQDVKITASILRSLGMALSSAVLMNIFIVGINQIFDVPIDKINKPDLPLPKGSLTTNGAIGIVSVAVITSLLLGSFSGSRPLQITLVASMILGIAYSTDLPFLRWKRNAVVAALCILTIRAVAVQLGFYFHMKQCCGPSNWVLTKPLVYATSLIAYFSVVIALFKDIPDVKGDRQMNVLTFSVQMGQKNVFWICIGLLTAMYVSALVIGLSSKVLSTRIFFNAGIFVSLVWLWKEAISVDLDVRQEIIRFYMFVWKLFYLLYFFIPLLRFS